MNSTAQKNIYIDRSSILWHDVQLAFGTGRKRSHATGESCPPTCDVADDLCGPEGSSSRPYAYVVARPLNGDGPTYKRALSLTLF